MRILILDDVVERHAYFRNELGNNHQLVHTWAYADCTRMLTQEDKFDVVFLDHDLSERQQMSRVGGPGFGDDLNGSDVVLFMVDRLPQEKRPNQVVVHSWNPAGAKFMIDTLKGAGFQNVSRWPFDPTKKLGV